MTETSSIDAAEVAKFSALAAEWWDPAGKFAPLHKFNPVRLGFIRDTAAAHFGRDPKSLQPFEGLTLLDIGCGGGLLSEPMARLGFAVTGRRCLGAEYRHGRGPCRRSRASTIDYRATTAEALAAEGADLRCRAQHGSGRACRRPAAPISRPAPAW